MAAEPPDFLAGLRTRFLLRAAEDLQALTAAGAWSADLDGRVHRLAGSAAMFGFAQAGAAALAIDQARAADRTVDPSALQALVRALEALPPPT